MTENTKTEQKLKTFKEIADSIRSSSSGFMKESIGADPEFFIVQGSEVIESTTLFGKNDRASAIIRQGFIYPIETPYIIVVIFIFIENVHKKILY